MKVFVGILVVLILLAAGTLGALAIWDIYPVSLTLIKRTGVTILIASAVVAFVWQAAAVFFKKEKHQNDGNNAHRMN